MVTCGGYSAPQPERVRLRRPTVWFNRNAGKGDRSLGHGGARFLPNHHLHRSDLNTVEETEGMWELLDMRRKAERLRRPTVRTRVTIPQTI